ncbi:MAG: restriction endonuclease [Crocinitomicaceae bacterium]|nr:restriction endonuclease [Crocinitomicaceae bacterium]
MELRVKRQSGELIDFDINKLKYSLSKSGASDIEISEVLENMLPRIHDGMSTKSIYQMAFSQLKRVSGTFAARYSLKRALMELGPAGFYFEQWVARFLESYGYETCTNQIIQGEAVSHEADVIAKKEEEMYWIECKFRNTMTSKISVTTPMYLLSRIRDISAKPHELFGGMRKFTMGWLITNTYFTTDATSFGEYYGLKMLSWDYPAKRSLKTLVDQKALYPITCLTNLSKNEKTYLLDKGYILVKDLYGKDELFDDNMIKSKNKHKIKTEIAELIQEV